MIVQRVRTFAAVAVVAAGVAMAPSIGSAAPKSPFANYYCQGTRFTLFNNLNKAKVHDGGTPPTFSTGGRVLCLTYMQTFHWNKGKGALPGLLSLTKVSGPAGLPAHTLFFQGKGTTNKTNALTVTTHAIVSVAPPTIIDGAYRCVDSAASTWSSNAASGGKTFCLVEVSPAVNAG